MASWDRNFTGGQYANNWHSRLDYVLNGQNSDGNYSNISLRMYVYSDNGYSQYGNWVPRGRGSWMGEYGGNVNREIKSTNGFVLMAAWDGNIGHDVNGNLYVTMGTYCNAPVNNMAWADIGWSLPRIAKAPSIADVVADNITASTARLGLEIFNHGNGTSTNMRMYYRKRGDQNFTPTPDQGDASGHNYWNLDGLQQATTYEYLGRVWNNNGDSRDSGVYTFTTKSATNLLAQLI